MKFTTIAKAKELTGLSYLGTINSSAKIIKNKKMGHYTYIVYLAPAKTSGYNVCSHSTPECRLGCLATSGRTGMEIIAGKSIIQNARIKKTRLFFEHPGFFMSWMVAEINYFKNKAKKEGYGFSVRLNGTSDIDWQNIYFDGKNIFQIFPDVLFYDYTKNPQKFENKPENYHLTFSYTGKNWENCEKLLKEKHNIAVVFNVKNESDLPETFKGYKVINGDETDARFFDERGVIVGLKFKRIANKIAEKKVLKSKFVVKINVSDLQLV